MAKLIQRGQKVVSPCARTFWVAKAWMKFAKYRRTFGCETDGLWLNLSLQSTLVLFARQVLKENLDVKGRTKVVAAARMYLSATDWVQGRERRKCQMPLRHSCDSVVSEACCALPVEQFQDHSLLEMELHVTETESSKKWQAQRFELDTKMLLVVECGALRVTLKKLLISYLQSRSGIFAAAWFEMVDVVGGYSATLVYKNVIQPQHKTKTYGVALMVGAVETVVSLEIGCRRRCLGMQHRSWRKCSKHRVPTLIYSRRGRRKANWTWCLLVPLKFKEWKM